MSIMGEKIDRWKVLDQFEREVRQLEEKYKISRAEKLRFIATQAYNCIEKPKDEWIEFWGGK